MQMVKPATIIEPSKEPSEPSNAKADPEATLSVQVENLEALLKLIKLLQIPSEPSAQQATVEAIKKLTPIEYAKKSYSMNQERILKKHRARIELLKNSDVYQASRRQQLIEDLNSGKQKWLRESTQLKFDIKRCPKTLQYF